MYGLSEINSPYIRQKIGRYFDVWGPMIVMIVLTRGLFLSRVIGASRLMMEEGIDGLATSLHSCVHLDDSFLTLIEGPCPKQQKCNGDWPDLKNLTPRMFKANEDEHLNKTIFTFEHLKS